MLKICIVEDEKLIALDLNDQLISMGFKVCSIVDNFKDAVNTANLLKPDVFILDINITGKYDGIDTASYINKNHESKIIFYSSLPESFYADRLINIRYQNFLSKPSPGNEFRILLNSFYNTNSERN